MNEELMITKEDLVNWLNRSPSNDDLDLIGFITTRLENFYKLEQENKQLKEQLENKIDLYEDTISYQLGFDKCKEYMQQRIDKAIEEIKTIKQHYEELRKAPFEDSVFINDMLRQSFITTIESYLDLFLEILGDKE